MNLPILVVGSSGTGKSTSLRNLNFGAETGYYFINTEAKPVPYKVTYDKKWEYKPDDYNAFLKRYEMCINNPAVTMIVVDSLTSTLEMVRTEMERLTSNTFEVFTKYNKEIRKILWLGKRANKPIVFTGIDELLRDENGAFFKRMKVSGKEWEGLIEKEFTIVFWTKVVQENDGTKYKFVTNGYHSSKSPMGLFAEKEINNDIAEVIKECYAFYDEPILTPIINKNKEADNATNTTTS